MHKLVLDVHGMNGIWLSDCKVNAMPYQISIDNKWKDIIWGQLKLLFHRKR